LIPLFKVYMNPSTIKDLKPVLYSGYVAQGPKVEEFESKLRDFFQHPHVLTTNACTNSLHLAYRLAGVKAGSEVISTALTCSATNLPILERGGKVVWADIESNTGNIDPMDVERKITDKTKAVVAVDWGGNPCNYVELRRICDENDLKLITDAAHSLGALLDGVPSNKYSDFVCYSFQAIKHLTTGDGGALLCKNEKDYEKGKLLRWFGLDRNKPGFRASQDIVEHGYKFHMNDIAASIGLSNLPNISKLLEKHRSNARYYKEAFERIPGVSSFDFNEGSSCWIYSILVDDFEGFIKRMEAKGIGVSKVHARNDVHSCFKESKTSLPVLDEVFPKLFCLPVGWWVTENNREYIVQCVRECV